MELDEWLALPHAEQRARRANWQGQPSLRSDPLAVEWVDLLSSATERLKALYSNHSDIVRFDCSCQFNDDHPPGISIATRLKKGQLIPDLPTTYLTFSVDQNPIGDDIEAHKQTWSVVLRRLFGWRNRDIAEFLKGMEWVWEDFWFLHDQPCKFLPYGQIITVLFKNAKNYHLLDRHLISKELRDAIGGGFYLHNEPDFDWEAAEHRIAMVVAEHDNI